MTGTTHKWIRESVSSEDAPSAIGPYSQAVAAGPLVFASGQLGIKPGTKELVSDDVGEQTRQAMENLAGVLDAGGSTLEMILRTEIYLKNIKDFSVVNEVYGSCFDLDPPARITVEVAELPMGAKVEISAVALRD